MKRQVWLTTLIGMLAIGCGDDVTATTDTDTDTDGTTSTTTDPGSTSTDPGSTSTDPGTTTSSTDPGTDTEDPSDTEDTATDTEDPTDDTSDAVPTEFLITIENISDQGPIPTPFSPGVWIEQDSTAAPVFTANTEASEGLELMAEDGDPSTLATAIDGSAGVMQSGVFDTPVDADAAAPIMPGERYEVQFTAQPDSRLGLASMMVASNDVFWATGPQGVTLFLPNGDPVDRDITTFLNLYDAGTEANQPPGGGSFQPPGIDGPGEDGVISIKGESTRAIVGAGRLIDVDVDLNIDAEAMTFDYVITFNNVSGDTGGFVSPLSPVAWALHDDTVTLLPDSGNAADVAGLEALAEDGDATTLEATLAGLAGVDQNGVAGDAPFGAGESVSITVVPAAGSDTLSFATMVVHSNDAFLAVEGPGIRMLEDDGVPRSPSAISNEIAELIAVWDAGTEANQTPGAGADQPAIGGADTGEADENANIRYYFDATNDLENITDDVNVLVSIEGGNVEISILNVSEGSAFEFGLESGIAAMTTDAVSLFELDAAATAGLESLAEDGEPAAMVAEVDALTDGEVQTVEAIPTDDLETVTLTAPTDAAPVFHFAAMISQSNDSFLSTGPSGVVLFDDGGALLSEEEIEDAILDALVLYDAGTERNQAAAVGADMEINQAAPNTGESEGNGLVRIVSQGANGELTNEPVWEYPRLDQLIRVTVAPVAR